MKSIFHGVVTSRNSLVMQYKIKLFIDTKNGTLFQGQELALEQCLTHRNQGYSLKGSMSSTVLVANAVRTFKMDELKGKIT